MPLAYDKVYQSRGLTNASSKEYVTEPAENVALSHNFSSGRFFTQIIDNIPLGFDMAIPGEKILPDASVGVSQ